VTTTKLGLLNQALIEIGDNTLSDTGDAVESARVLNTVYDQVVRECLSAGSWNFAMETAKVEADTGVTPSFGYTEVFAKPSDWMRTVGVSLDERFSFPLLHYYDDSNFWSADSSPIYVRYVSSDTGLGYALAKWPPTFARYVSLELAVRVCPRLTESEPKLERIILQRDDARLKALNHDAMNEPQPKFPPMGTWNAARSAGVRGDRGSRGNLTG
jgi:hypothetical protein